MNVNFNESEIYTIESLCHIVFTMDLIQDDKYKGFRNDVRRLLDKIENETEQDYNTN